MWSLPSRSLPSRLPRRARKKAKLLTAAEKRMKPVLWDHHNDFLDADGGDGAPAAVDEGIGCIDSDSVGVIARLWPVRLNERRQTIPAADITPASAEGEEADVLLFFHYSVVDGDRGNTFKRGLRQCGLVIACQARLPAGIRRAGQVWRVTPETLDAGISPHHEDCLLYTSPSPRDGLLSRMPSSA